MNISGLATTLLLLAAGADCGLAKSDATIATAAAPKRAVEHPYVQLFRRLAEAGGEQGWYNKTESAHTKSVARAAATACAAGHTDTYKGDVDAKTKISPNLKILDVIAPATEGSYSHKLTTPGPYTTGCGARTDATHCTTCDAPFLRSPLLGNLVKECDTAHGFARSGVVSDLTSATTTDAVEADLASTFENRIRCLSERRLDGVDPKKSIVPSETILLDVEGDEGCQRRTASGMIPKSYKGTRDLFRNQVDEQTPARLGDTQQRKTTFSTMMVDNLELEILEVRFERTISSLERSITHFPSLPLLSHSALLPTVLYVRSTPSHPAADSPRRTRYTR